MEGFVEEEGGGGREGCREGGRRGVRGDKPEGRAGKGPRRRKGIGDVEKIGTGGSELGGREMKINVGEGEKFRED